MLKLNAVYKKYGNNIAVHDVTLEVNRGQIVALLGPSGCGKTTTLRIIAGFVKPDRGMIELNGIGMGTRRPYERNVGIVFQDYALFPHMTVEQNVMFGPRRRGVPSRALKERAAKYLDLVRLSDFERRMPQTLSGGQQQRVAVARALATEPAVLLLDEPLSALDTKLRIELRSELREILVSARCATIIVTHDQEEAMTLADHVHVMNLGRIVQSGSANSIYKKPIDRFVASFMGRANFLEGTLVAGQDCLQFVMEGGLALPMPGVLEAPGPAQLMLRPEDLHLTRPDQHPSHIVLNAVALHTLYLGADREITVRLENGAILSALMRSNSGPAPGNNLPVSLHFDPAEVVWFR